MSKRRIFVVLRSLCFVAWCVSAVAQTPTAPKYKFDPDWPKTMPNKWKIGGVTGLAADKDDNVWVYDRPNDLRDMELKAELTPAIADCCVRPPSMIHIDKAGSVIGSFDPPQGHGMAVDSKGFVYLGNTVPGKGNTVRKYDPKTGKLLMEVPRLPVPDNGAPDADAQPVNRQPGRGGPGATGTFPAQGRGGAAAAAPAGGANAAGGGGGGRGGGGGGRGGANAAAPAPAAAPAESPTMPMIVGQIEEVRIDDAAHELYAADSYNGGRVMVFDLDTFAFKRGWGAYGHKLSEISTAAADHAYTPGGPFAKEFRGHLTLNISNDGLVYAADRAGNRVHVTDKQGKFVKEIPVAPNTAGGSAGGVMFSPDKEQKFLYICDINNNHVWFIDRQSGKTVGSLGSMGENGGQFFGLHMIATDSKGNIYTGEVFNGERVQRFVPVR
jgi:DNA-binding beta-propeller fold protein YncE